MPILHSAGSDWIEVYSTLNIPAGTNLTFQNQADYPAYLLQSDTKPGPKEIGYRLSPGQDREAYGKIALWARGIPAGIALFVQEL